MLKLEQLPLPNLAIALHSLNQTDVHQELAIWSQKTYDALRLHGFSNAQAMQLLTAQWGQFPTDTTTKQGEPNDTITRHDDTSTNTNQASNAFD